MLQICLLMNLNILFYVKLLFELNNNILNFLLISLAVLLYILFKGDCIVIVLQKHAIWIRYQRQRRVWRLMWHVSCDADSWACALQWRHDGHNGVSKSPASRLFTQLFIQAQIKENIKTPRHWPLCREFTGQRWIPRTKGHWRGKCFHLMTSSCGQTRIMGCAWPSLSWWCK